MGMAEEKTESDLTTGFSERRQADQRASVTSTRALTSSPIFHSFCLAHHVLTRELWCPDGERLPTA